MAWVVVVVVKGVCVGVWAVASAMTSENNSFVAATCVSLGHMKCVKRALPWPPCEVA